MSVRDYDLYYGAVINQLLKNKAQVEFLEQEGRGFYLVNDVLLMHVKHASRTNGKYLFTFSNDLIERYGNLIELSGNKLYVVLFCIDDQSTVALDYYDLRMLIESAKRNRHEDFMSYSVYVMLIKNKKVRISIGNGGCLEESDEDRIVSRSDFPRVIIDEISLLLSEKSDSKEECDVHAVNTVLINSDEDKILAETNRLYRIAKANISGEGGDKDIMKGAALMLSVAESGFAEAQAEMANAYYDGIGVEKDLAKAAFWAKKSAEQGDALGQFILGVMLCNGDGGLDQDYAESFMLLKKSAEAGNAKGQNSLGILYENGFGVNQDYTKAFQWFQKSAEAGDEGAQYAIAILYFFGRGVDTDHDEAFRWLNKSAEAGNADAQNSLGVLYANGQGVKQDYGKAVMWYQKAGDAGNECALINLGMKYAKGQGVEKDTAKFLEFIEKGGKAGEGKGEISKENFNIIYDKSTQAGPGLA